MLASMASSENIVHMFGSTTWHHEDGRLAPGRRAGKHSGAAGASIWGLRVRDRRRTLQINVRFTGGAEGMWEATARGFRWRFPGHLAFNDVLAWMNREL